MSPGCSIVGGAEADRRLAAVVGTDIRGDNINGAPSGVVGVRNCCAVKPCIPGDNKRDSAAVWARRRHSSSHAKICESNEKLEDPKWWTFYTYIFIVCLSLFNFAQSYVNHVRTHKIIAKSIWLAARMRGQIQNSQLTFDCVIFNGF